MIQKPNHCRSCYGWKWGSCGFVPSDGEGKNGVLVVLEAAGENEAAEGRPTIGKAGLFLWSNLKRVGLDREDFRIHNVLSCRPENNKLSGMFYEKQVIDHCAPLLDETIFDHVKRAKENSKTPVILALGRIAFKRVMGFDDKNPIMRGDYHSYPFWTEKYQSWVLTSYHPAFLMRGSSHLIPVLQFAAKRAVEIAEHGLTLSRPTYLLDPTPAEFASWIIDYEIELNRNPLTTFLSYDIETPFKSGKDEEEVSKEDDDDYTILRCSFAYRSGYAVSVPWRAEYLPLLERLFANTGAKVGWNNCPTPDQRVLTADLRWIPAGELKVGDKLVGLDEFVPEGHRLRRYKTSVVTRANKGQAIVLKVGFSDGSFVKVTGEHQWLIPQRHRTRELRVFGGSSWTKTIELKVGSKILRKFDPWETNNSREAGYLAGFFDGEGHISQPIKGAMCVGAAQNNGPTLELVLKTIDDLGFKSRRKTHNREKDKHLTNFVIPNGTNGSTRFLGSIRPQRLLSKFVPEALGAVWSLNTDELTISSIQNLGLQEIIELSTDEHTYLLEGFAAHNCNYDEPRVRAQVEINGDQIDGMLAWHVLNSALPKGLGFVTPFYAQGSSMWKHLSSAEPAFYNAKDADMALQNFLGIKKDLEGNGLWEVFKRHIIELNRVLSYMSSKGVKRDEAMRADAEQRLQKLLDEINEKMASSIPFEAKQLKVYKKTPKDLTGLIEVDRQVIDKFCLGCGERGVKKAHFKSIGKKKLKAGEPENPCFGLTIKKKNVITKLYAKPLDFKVSNLAMQRYQRAVKHQAIINHKEKKVTFDEKAITRLQKKYPNDPLYPIILEYRKIQKLLSTYVGVTQLYG